MFPLPIDLVKPMMEVLNRSAGTGSAAEAPNGAAGGETRAVDPAVDAGQLPLAPSLEARDRQRVGDR